VLRYLCGTFDYYLVYFGTNSVDKTFGIQGFVNADWAGDLDSQRSTSGYVFTLFGGAMSCMSKMQPTVALSTTEIEYMATTHVSREVVWLQILCTSISFDYKIIQIGCDGQSVICLAKNSMYHARTKHVDVQYYFVREMIANG